jgi:hypothetical protein
MRFLDHTQRRTTIGRPLLEEWSVRHRDLYLTTHNTHTRQETRDIHQFSGYDSNPQSQQAIGCRPTPSSARQLGLASCKLMADISTSLVYLTLLSQLLILDLTYLGQLLTRRTSICLLYVTVNCQFVERTVAPAPAINTNMCYRSATAASLTSTPNGLVSFKAQPLYPREKDKGTPWMGELLSQWTLCRRSKFFALARIDQLMV